MLGGGNKGENAADRRTRGALKPPQRLPHLVDGPGARGKEGHQRVPALVVGGQPPRLQRLAQRAGRAHQDLVPRLVQQARIHAVPPRACGQQRRFIHQIAQLRAGEAWRGREACVWGETMGEVTPAEGKLQWHGTLQLPAVLVLHTGFPHTRSTPRPPPNLTPPGVRRARLSLSTSAASGLPLK